MVVDASAVVEYLLGSSRGAAVRNHMHDGGDGSARLHAPAHMDIEVAQALRRMEAAGVLDGSRAAQTVRLLGDLPIRRHVATALLPRVWDHRQNLTAYDAGYVALAEALGCPLLTCDAHLSRAPGITVPMLVAS